MGLFYIINAMGYATFINFLHLIELAIIVGLVFLIAFRSNQEQANRYFIFILLTAGVWILGNFLVNLSTQNNDQGAVLLWTKLSIVGPSLMAPTMVLFAGSFKQVSSHALIKKKQKIFLYIPAVLLIIFSLTKYNIISTQIVDPNFNISSYVPGFIYYLFLAYFLICFAIFASIFLKKIHASHGQTRSLIKLIFTGFLLTVAATLITSVLLPLAGNLNFISAAPLFVIIFLGITTYAIIAHKLFDIRLIVKRTLVFTILLAFVFAVYTSIIVILTQVLQQGTQTKQSFFANLLAALIIGFSFEPLRIWISDRTDKWLFKKEYEQQAVISNLNKNLNDVIAMDEALEIVMKTITHVLHLHHAATYVFQPAENNTTAVKRVKQMGYNSTTNLILDDKDFTLRYFSENTQILLVQDLELEVEREKELLKGRGNTKDTKFIRQHAIKQAALRKLEQLNVAAAVPLNLNNQPIGLILLSEKLNGEVYHPQDLALLELVGAQAISSIQKAKLYEGDQMKSEFVSIASHELLTPISAIEGYLSMILEEHIGKVDKQAEEYLTKVYSSAKRLSALIKDLLSVSRIESGKMKIIAQQLDVDKAIKETIDQLRFIAADKHLELIYHQATEPLPPVWADPDRTAQILVNLLSNAIKYTPQGSVTITPTLLKREGFVSIAVADTGLGMGKQAVQHLFNKFYRIDTPETAGIAGTGLGLYITKSLIEKMGGSINVKSTEGKGSVFTFTLPLFKVETSQMQ